MRKQLIIPGLWLNTCFLSDYRNVTLKKMKGKLLNDQIATSQQDLTFTLR